MTAESSYTRLCPLNDEHSNTTTDAVDIILFFGFVPTPPNTTTEDDLTQVLPSSALLSLVDHAFFLVLELLGVKSDDHPFVVFAVVSRDYLL